MATLSLSGNIKKERLIIMGTMLKILITILIFVSIWLGCHAQQRGITSTYMFNGLTLNPAYAGSLNELSVTYVHRKQWLNIEGAPTYQVFNAHNSFFSNRIGIGVLASNDKVGSHNDNGLYLSTAYKIRTGMGILSMGISGGFNNRVTDFTELNLKDTDDPLLSGVQKNFSPNFGTGVYFANPNVFVGLCIPYVMESKVYKNVDGLDNSFLRSRESRYYYATAGGLFHLSNQVKLNPSVLLRLHEEAAFSWDANINVIFDKIAYLGVNIRKSGELTFLGQIILNMNVRVGYAYDAVTNELNNRSTGSHEIFLNYRVKLRNYKKDPQCPVYF